MTDVVIEETMEEMRAKIQNLQDLLVEKEHTTILFEAEALAAEERGHDEAIKNFDKLRELVDDLRASRFGDIERARFEIDYDSLLRQQRAGNI